VCPITPLKLEKPVITKHTLEDTPCCQLQLMHSNPNVERIELQFDMDGTEGEKLIRFIWPQQRGKS